MSDHDSIGTSPGTVNNGSSGKAERLFLSFLRDLDCAPPEEGQIGINFCALGDTFRSSRLDGLAEQAYRTALVLRQTAVGHEHPSLTPVLEKLVSFYCDVRQFAKARAFLRRLRLIAEGLALRKGKAGEAGHAQIRMHQARLDRLREHDCLHIQQQSPCFD